MEFQPIPKRTKRNLKLRMELDGFSGEFPPFQYDHSAFVRFIRNAIIGVVLIIFTSLFYVFEAGFPSTLDEWVVFIIPILITMVAFSFSNRPAFGQWRRALLGSDQREHAPVPFRLGPTRFTVGEVTLLYTDVAHIRLTGNERGAENYLQLFTNQDVEHRWLVSARERRDVQWILNQIRRRAQQLNQGEIPEDIQHMRRSTERTRN